MNDDITIDIGPISLFDANAVEIALSSTIARGYFLNPEAYAAVMNVRALLTYRIAKAEQTATWAEPA